VVKRKSSGKVKTDPDRTNATRTAPDPFVAVLPALAALGAVCSIATINWVAEDEKPSDGARSRRKAIVALRELESSCLGLAEIFRRFQRHPNIFAGEGGAAVSPLKFGVHGPRLETKVAQLYHRLINDVASMLVLSTQNAFDVMAAVEDGEIDAPESLFFSFGDCQERLNKIIQERASLKTAVDQGLDIAEELIGLVRDLKRCLAT
jgi:hypothetical protein